MLEIWNRRSLILTFAINDLRDRYRGSVLGFIWTFLEPLLILSVLYFVFTNVFKSGIENYAVFLLLGITMWNFFARGTSMGMNSFISKTGIINKTYLPREILPLSSTITSLFMAIFEFGILFVFFIAFNFIPPQTILLLPFLVMLEFVLVLGIAYSLSVLSVRYRDVQYIWGVIITAGFFAVPIFYSFDILPENIKQILLLNPMAHIIEISHDVVLNGVLPEISGVIYTITISFSLLIIGGIIFKFLNYKVIEDL